MEIIEEMIRLIYLWYGPCDVFATATDNGKNEFAELDTCLYSILAVSQRYWQIPDRRKKDCQ